MSASSTLASTKNINTSSTAEVIAACMPYGFAVDLVLHNFIASIVSVKEINSNTKVAQGLLALIVINTACMTYTQCKLIFKAFEKARSKQADAATGSTVFYMSQSDFEQHKSDNTLEKGIYSIDNSNKYYQVLKNVEGLPNIVKELTLRVMSKDVRNFGDKDIIKHLDLYYTFNEYTETNAPQILTAKNQVQALIGFLSSVEAGVRWAYSVEVVVNSNISSVLLKSIIAAIAGIGRGGAFCWSSGHAACDVPLGKTYTGSMLYGVLTFPLMPDLVKYITVTSPAAIAAVYSSAIIKTKYALEIEDPTVSFLFYTVALFSGIMGFLAQKGYTCDVMYNNVGKNLNCVDEWNEFWYGDSGNANLLQKIAYATKRFIDIVSVLPLATLDIADRLFSVCCYFVLAILPIQIIALSQYMSYPALTYWIYYQVFHNTQDLIEAYTGKSTPELSAKTQFVATFTLALLLGETAAFTMSNVSGRHILSGANLVYNTAENVINMTGQTSNTPLLSHENTPQSGLKHRLSSVITFAKNSGSGFLGWFKKQIYGENGLNST